MAFIIVGTNYRYSPIILRERIFFPKKGLKDALCFLKERKGLEGAIILSTCNRVEIYAAVEESQKGVREIENFISQYHEINIGALSPYLYIYEGKEALKHLFCVACGLDSLILGETQILEQVKSSFLESEKEHFVNNFLREIFYYAVYLAREVHRDTHISKGDVSVGSIAIDFIKEQLGSLAGKNILIIGTGKVTELVLQHLNEEGPNIVFIANRTFEKAKGLASKIGTRAVRFNELQQVLENTDILITATASPHFIIKKETLKDVIAHKILIIDLALPRDVDPQVKEIEEVELFYIEDLENVIKKNIAGRIQDSEKIKEIIDLEAEKIWRRFTELEQEPALLR